jgi:hypothetical protein
MSASRYRHYFLPTGTFCFNSSNQFSTTLICVGAASDCSTGLSIRKRWPSGETSQFSYTSGLGWYWPSKSIRGLPAEKLGRGTPRPFHPHQSLREFRRALDVGRRGWPRAPAKFGIGEVYRLLGDKTVFFGEDRKAQKAELGEAEARNGNQKSATSEAKKLLRSRFLPLQRWQVCVSNVSEISFGVHFCSLSLPCSISSTGSDGAIHCLALTLYTDA